MCFGVRGAVPVQVVAPRTHPALSYSPIETSRYRRALDVSIGPPDRCCQHTSLGLHDADVAIQSHLVKCAAGAPGEAGPVEEDAAIIDDSGLATAVCILLGDLVCPEVLPLVCGDPFFTRFSSALSEKCAPSVQHPSSDRRTSLHLSRRCRSSCS